MTARVHPWLVIPCLTEIERWNLAKIEVFSGLK
jgi:hypothetical protein